MDRKKLDAWAREIGRSVEQSMNRRTSMLGLRSP
jgi:hypothetical protein